MSRTTGPRAELRRNLGYLLKHAHLRMAELGDEALVPIGINGRELGGLLALDDAGPVSQQQVAGRLGIDRTTTVALVDALERKGLVSRHPHAEDRRRNVIELTTDGRDTLRRAVDAHDEAERALLAALDPRAARALRDALGAVVDGPDTGR